MVRPLRALRLAISPRRASNQNGETAFTFEIVADLASAADASPYAARADLKALEAEWRERLGARAVAG
jgi:hypothetical protein